MKKSTMFLTALLCMMMQTVSTFAFERVIPSEQLPAAAKTFLHKNFPGKAIAYAKVDNEFMKTTYEVRLNDGSKLKFDKNGNWDKVNLKTKAVPSHLVPQFIANHVKANYAGAVIVKIDKERYGYDIELSNDIDLRFNNQGKLIRID